ncbi:MAG: GNAT family N-acetyltransferase, partial [Azoarcus sp.]|nr:GNAT family N-acetyltransferase [Azoarcus sp.]
MLQTRQQVASRPGRNFHVGLATCDTEILEAQKLRYRVFAEEMGARLSTRTPGVDRDIYDPFCEHLIVRDEDAGRIVGTYRNLSPSAACEVG